MTPTVLQTVYHFSPTIALQANSLAIVFWIIAGLALAGAFAAIFAGALAAVARKRRELSVLRLLGFSTGGLLLFVVMQALYSAGFAAVLVMGWFARVESVLDPLLQFFRQTSALALSVWNWVRYGPVWVLR